MSLYDFSLTCILFLTCFVVPDSDLDCESYLLLSNDFNDSSTDIIFITPSFLMLEIYCKML